MRVLVVVVVVVIVVMIVVVVIVSQCDGVSSIPIALLCFPVFSSQCS